MTRDPGEAVTFDAPCPCGPHAATWTVTRHPEQYVGGVHSTPPPSYDVACPADAAAA